MYITGHCLIGHSQLAQWFCVDKDGKNVSPEILQQRMKNQLKYLQPIITQYFASNKSEIWP